MTAERVLLTGATGFVGGHLARSLVARGVAVTALVRPASSGRVPDGVIANAIPDSADELASVVGAARPDVCVHLATNFLARHQPDDVVSLLEANVIFGARLAEALVAVGGTPLIDVGTLWQHVDGARFRPANLYAASKQALADVLVAYSLRHGLPVARLTLTDTYGPDDARPRLIPLLLRAAATGAEVPLSSGTQLIDLVHVHDVVAAFELLADRLTDQDQPLVPSPEGTTGFGVSSGAPITIRQLVATLEQVVGHPMDVHWGAQPDRQVEMREPWDPGPPPPGWHPHIDLPTGLATLLRTP